MQNAYVIRARMLSSDPPDIEHLQEMVGPQITFAQVVKVLEESTVLPSVTGLQQEKCLDLLRKLFKVQEENRLSGLAGLASDI